MLDYYITKVDHPKSCTSFTCDVALTPLRWVAGGRSYEIIKTHTGEFSHLLRTDNPSLLYEIARRIAGFVLTLFMWPAILYAMWTKNHDVDALENYQFIQLCSSQQWPVLQASGFSHAPKPISPSPNDLAAAEHCSLDTLLTIWDSVGKSHANYAAVRQDLQTWLSDKVPHPNQYNFITQQMAPHACQQLQKDLKLIIHEMGKDTISNDRKERLILSLHDASTVCSPTWLEIASREYCRLKGGDSAVQKVLRYVQNVKEDRILDYGNALGIQWHLLNYARWIMGSDIGLDNSRIAFDNALVYKVQDGYSKPVCYALFKQVFTYEVLNQGLMTKINLDNLGSNGYDQELGPLLAQCADKHASRLGIDITHDDYDQGTYVINNFYDKTSDNKYSINVDGVREMLLEIGLITFV